ncbi:MULTISPECIES: nucleotidyl transferase AbiEii/AbiGii toxin family protein [Lactococcus]|jgi:predicted nucleotidyltransferase component of viral defense system|uniref:Nucleotidyl transferase AbiEii/AbiGii toxin family protein n=1 Tax=Lactococcus lactis TaxID=1358 RepID=A0AAW8UD39_9LACT|nr:nucleotidyl transferase AbiEii/AbiGii toxin family protein [Lactococcus lactis]MDT2859948.1 nucleotidyl transferase AbiEii/AbiGii toxin family protein [Lactococcus lactis]MDT2863187.1 nucleotidyl transferase AbiEii/AbiGii toxin family protein [Lactococcus lactis]MDT2868624.1 nucleotidyl transferase AbiEii/AbiGii toxin family protein [Lactococcus lactis]MDT2869547.1 nucleotidyl transferase AbiEii/AbiGii toxin family protein [Lactococcus lactis]MDT2874925.1 nucleotidyl transferase AbiEii/AbiG
MIFKNAMSFKSKIKQIAKEKKITTQQVQQSYLIEVFLEKLAKSPYRDNFILKGGYLIGGIVGLDQRATMDLDTTVKGFELTLEKLTNITEEIITIPTDESFTLSFDNVSEIRETDDYPGFKLKLYADFERIHELVSIDVTTGDAITPREIEFSINRLFSDDKLSLLSYPIETIIAEKVETILARGVASTRPRDFYDVYMISKLRWNEINFTTLANALNNTMTKRESKLQLNDYPAIIEQLKTSQVQQQLWKKYQREYNYAKDLSFNEVVDSVLRIVENIEK